MSEKQTIQSLLQENQDLKDKLKIYEESPHEIAYRAATNTVNKLSEQLKDKHIDLFNSEDKPKFEMMHKFLTELTFYLDTIDKIRAKMNPEIAKQIDKQAKQEKLNDTDKSLPL